MSDDPKRSMAVVESAQGVGQGEDQGTNWARARDIPLAILGWALVIFVAFWAAGHIIGTLLVLAIAALIAYALAPVISLLRRWLPLPLAIAIVYLVFVGLLLLLVSVIVDTAIQQAGPLSDRIGLLLTPGSSSNAALVDLQHHLGITDQQLRDFRNTLIGQATGVARDLVPVVTGVAGGLINIIVTLIISVYFVANAPRVGLWLRSGLPMRVRPRAVFVLDTTNRVIGGYIRGQLTLSALVGVLVGASMYVLQIPYAILLGFMAFVLEFIPFLGVLISGAACVLVALTQGVVTALIVLAVFVIIHVIEGDVVGPRIVGSAIGLHPAISIIALIAGAELFGLWGALFAAPIAGVAQAVTVTFWREWKLSHPEQFPTGSTVSYDVAVVPVATEPEDRPPIDGSPGDGGASGTSGDGGAARDASDTDQSRATPQV
ncbi:MAG TPA: AI-2E family transporter [Ktedonobacterales bacterium]|nr:AI-2E family transporter [Ktedonobacterales bacterium]